jgi:CelD/BcsL family acetyltransferase involved in cellulose biosynthesis
MRTAVTVDPLADPRWRNLLARSPQASVFHQPAWLRLLHASYRYPVSACCLASDGGQLVAGLPVATVASRLTGRRMVALPFSDVCPALVARDAPAHARWELGDALAELQRSSELPLELRSPSEVVLDATPGERFHHHVLQLEPDITAVTRRFARPQALRGVRRAVREGLRAQVRTDRDALAVFYALHMATRRRLGVPTQPRRFILGLERMFDDGLGFVLLVRPEHERAVAAAVFLTCDGVLTYKYGASDPGALAARPNNLLFMEAIRWGCERGYRRLDLGRTHWGQEGLRAFKLSWGAEERELRYRHLGGAAPREARVGGALATLIRRSPPAASRLIGEVLYRHAG